MIFNSRNCEIYDELEPDVYQELTNQLNELGAILGGSETIGELETLLAEILEEDAAHAAAAETYSY